MRATSVAAVYRGSGTDLLTWEVMTEVSLLTEECCTSHEGGIVSVTATTRRRVQCDQVGTCDHTATSEVGSDVLQFRY